VVPNWADQDAIRPVAAADNPLRREWGLEGRFVVCYSGNMGRAHEFDTILDAAQRLALTAAHIRFLFIGSGAQRRPVEEAAHQRGLANGLFRPYQERERLTLSLGVGDVHLVSLRPEREGYIFPSKLYGVLAAGRPTVFIGDPQGEIARLIEREGIGAAVRQGDAAGLVDALAQLAGNPGLRQTMGRRARELLCERYDKVIAMKDWLALLEKL
jgi:glycosyltransferase involved in cell wall biosynthesis